MHNVVFLPLRINLNQRLFLTLSQKMDSLIFEDRLEVKLLEYVYTTILFSDRNVNPHLVSWNR